MVTLLATLLLLQEAEIREGKTFVSKTHNLTFSVPSANWGTLRFGKDLEWKWVGAICEGLDAKESVGITLTAENAGQTNTDYIEFFERSMAKGVDSKRFVKTGEKTLDGRTGEWLRREYDWDFRDLTFVCIVVFTRQGTFNYKFCAWVEKRIWDEHKDTVNEILETFNLFEPK